MTPELSRPVLLDRLPGSVTVTATPAECLALAGRFRIPAVERLSCHFTLRARGRTVEAHGDLDARVVQSCVVTLDPVAADVRERFTVHFVPAGEEATDADPDTPDEIPYDGPRIDLGDAAAEQLALALDPYPRHPDAALAGPAAQADGQGPEHGNDAAPAPFSALAALRRPN